MSNETVTIVSPVDGSVYAERPVASRAELDEAVERARRAQTAWRGVSIAERGEYLTRFVDALLAMNDRIVPELAWQMGRPVRYGGEANGVEERSRHMIAIAEAALQPAPRSGPGGVRRWIAREPAGVVLVIAPWNYPYLTAVNSIVPGLMAGNAVVLKHATQTLLAGEHFADAARAAALPEGLFQNMVLTHADTEAIIAAGAVDHVNFTGSVGGGRRIEQAAAGTFTTLGLELGGKDPAYVRPDAPLAAAIEQLADGAFYNSGQSCCAVERLYVHADVYDRFVDGFIETARSWTLGDPLDSATMVGPMATARGADSVRAQVADALSRGAVANLSPAHQQDREGSPYLAPQVLTDVDHAMPLMREETFGPVVGIMRVKDDAEAIRLMNDSPYGLTASIWTDDLDAAAQLGAQVETGTVFANRCDHVDPRLVWTGVKETGKGGTLSEVGYENLTRPKSYHMREL